MQKRGRWIGGMAVVLAVGAGLVMKLSPIGPLVIDGPPVGAGYAADLLCSGVFVSGRDPDRVMQEDILPVHRLLRHASFSVDREQNSATVNLFMAHRTAYYRPGLGCTLV